MDKQIPDHNKIDSNKDTISVIKAKIDSIKEQQNKIMNSEEQDNPNLKDNSSN